jgi:hypothetical protein
MLAVCAAPARASFGADTADGHCIAEVACTPGSPNTLNCRDECLASCVTVPVDVGTPAHPLPADACGCSESPVRTLSPCCQVVLLDDGSPSFGGRCGGADCAAGNSCQGDIIQLLVEPYTVTYRNARCAQN